jgi:hypothetical protein
MDLVVAGTDDGVGDGSVAMSDLSVEDGGLDLDFLDGLGRGDKAGVAGAGETFGRVVRDTVEGQPIMTGAAVPDDLDGDAGEGLGELAGLALHIGAGGDAGGEGGQDKRVTADVGEVGDLLGAEGGGDVRRSGIEQRVTGRNVNRLRDGARGEREIDDLNLAGGEYDVLTVLGFETGGGDADLVGAGIEGWEVVGTRTV